MSQDIGNRCVETSETCLALSVGGVQSPAGDHRCRRRGPSQAEVAAQLRRVQGLGSELVARYRAEGEAAFEPRSRRPRDVTDRDRRPRRSS